jgi:hypothetical protein
VQGQSCKINGEAFSHDSSSGTDFGQNQPIKVTAMGIEPHTTAHGEKIDQISITLVAIAAQNGQIELRGEASRASGLAAASDVTTSSRRSTRKPFATSLVSGNSQSGFDPFTTGMKAKL